MIDRSGLTYAFVLGELTGATPADALRAFLIVSAVFDLPDLWARTDELPGAVPADLVDGIMRETHRFLVRAAQWLLTRRPRPLSLSAEVEQFASPARTMRLRLPELLAGREAEAVRRQVEGLAERGVPMPLALHTAGLQPGIGLFDASRSRNGCRAFRSRTSCACTSPWRIECGDGVRSLRTHVSPDRVSPRRRASARRR